MLKIMLVLGAAAMALALAKVSLAPTATAIGPSTTGATIDIPALQKQAPRTLPVEQWSAF